VRGRADVLYGVARAAAAAAAPGYRGGITV